ncbi:MAG: zinc finger Ran-binding domain-containing protein, partial [Candidatus Poseidoniaceae archaeon]|nr:zinc finger Ran-binding domain-containing protein [Candidatus Poseidoniaceae archaeon]
RDRRGGDRRDGGRGNFDRGSRGRNDSNDGDWDCPKCNNSNFARRTECNRCGEPRSGGGGRRDGGRGNFDRGSRDRRDGGRRDGDRGGRRDFSNRDETRTKPKENNFRKSKGKRAGHAHNNAPKPIVPRKFSRNSDD